MHFHHPTAQAQSRMQSGVWNKTSSKRGIEQDIFRAGNEQGQSGTLTRTPLEWVMEQDTLRAGQ